MSHYTISFAYKVLHLVSLDLLPAIGLKHDLLLVERDNEHFTRAKILKFFETHNTITLAGASAEELFEHFALEFKRVTAAGGVVTTPRGEALMIYRNGRWDLPKGHLEPEEGLRACAAREIEEETGVAAGHLVRPLCDTWHIYNVYGCWELKHTFWYHFEREDAIRPAPQQEEGITRCEWCSTQEACRRAEESFPTLRAVMRNFMSPRP